MNVTCNKCGKKYLIADDKVAGKQTVKIRCKQCQNLITVAVMGGGAEAASPPPAPGRAEREAPSWYAMIGGKQQGPFLLEVLRHKAQGGEVTARTYVWRPGMADWKRAAEVPEVGAIFAAAAASAMAVGPVEPAPGPASSKRASPRTDVATANEVPVSESPPRKLASTVVYGTSAVADLHAEVKAAVAAAGSAQPGPGTPREEAPAGALAPSPATPAAGAGPLDPFAQFGPPVDPATAPPGEATKFFIAKAGVNRRNPPWKIALFIAGVVGIPVGLGYLLASFDIVPMTVTVIDEQGRESQESYFSPEGVSGLKDLLTGDARRKQEERAARQAAVEAEKRRAAEATTPGTPAKDPGKARPADPALAALMAADDRRPAALKVRRTEDDRPAVDSSAGLDAKVAMKVVGDKMKSFETCITNALHRNPKLNVGQVTLHITVGSSGAVKAVNVSPAIHADSDWARCMVTAARRIVFPASEGDTDLEVPFKVGVAFTP